MMTVEHVSLTTGMSGICSRSCSWLESLFHAESVVFVLLEPGKYSLALSSKLCWEPSLDAS